jgi:glutamyl-tRNA reductase
MMSKILSIGLSHHHTPVAVREQWAQLYANENEVWRSAQAYCTELVVLATCNRVELYAVVEDRLEGERGLRGLFSADSQPYLYMYEDEGAAHYLCQVAAGIDSLVVGEAQILGQINQAFAQAMSQRSCGAHLQALFRTAIMVGKRARTETHIGRNSASISSIAVQLAHRQLGELTHKQILLIGAGKMSQLALQALQSYHLGGVAIVNRTREKARDLAQRFGATAYPLDELPHLLLQADLVISATSTPHAVIDLPLLAPIMAQRVTPLTLIDIAVPRDIDPDVVELAGVSVFDLDALQATQAEAVRLRRTAVPAVQQIIADEIASLLGKWRELEIRPIITDFRLKAESIRQQELQRALRYLPSADAATRAQLEQFSQSLINKLLHDPTIRVRAMAYENEGDGERYAAALRDLFL